MKKTRKTKTQRPVRLKDYRPSGWLIDHVDLDMALAPSDTRVRARLKLRPNPAAEGGPGPLRLNGERLTLESVKLSGRKLGSEEYRLDEAFLEIAHPPARPFTLETVTRCDPEANTALEGLYRSRGIYCTQCEPEGFRRITYFLDRPDILATYRVRIEADREAAPVLLSNGNLVESGPVPAGGKAKAGRAGKGAGRHYAVWHDPFPKPSYLFALVGGDLGHVEDRFTTMSGRKVTLCIYVEPGKEERAAYAMDALKRAMAWDERRFGREYDLDMFMIVAVSDFNMGAMENKGLNIFNDKLILASPETATDADYAAIEGVIGHEYFHNWTGNRITCRDWFQLCLKEGLTVFRDQEFSADERSATVQRIKDVRLLKTHQFPEDAGPLAHPVRPEEYIEINNFYTATVYNKGAEVCRMLQTLLGREGFRKGCDLYFERHDGQAVTVEDFIRCFEDACERDLGQFMLWYRQAGTPHLVCTLDFDAARREAVLEVEQVLPETPDGKRKRAMHIPLRLGLLGGDGEELVLVDPKGTPIENGLIELTARKQRFRFTGIASRPVPSLLRGFSAPVNLTIDLSEHDIAFLMAHDSDLYNRWQAGQSYAMQLLVERVQAIRAGKTAQRGAPFAKALGATLADEALEPAFRAEMLKLPGESDVARELARDVDPNAIHRARTQLLRLVGRTLHETLEQVYRRHAVRGAYAPDAESAGRRALRHAALALLTAAGGPEDRARLAAHYGKARNMTERMAALTLLTDFPGDERDAAFAHFFRRARGDHLVIDKWFALQAISHHPGTLAAVEALTRHPDFDIRNPNKVRALIGSFAHANPVNFNRPDGAGYAFVADRILEIDAFNPQSASRLAQAFRSWRMLEPGRRRKARAALARIARHKGLSSDVGEIVGKMLA